MHVAFAIADAALGVGLVRKSTKESDWRDVPLIDSVREAFERQLARSTRTSQERRPGEHIFAGGPEVIQLIRPDSLSDRLDCRARPLESHAPGRASLRRDRRFDASVA